MKKLKRKFKQTDKNCLNCDDRFPIWMTKNYCPFCGSVQVQWISEREESYANAL